MSGVSSNSTLCNATAVARVTVVTCCSLRGLESSNASKGHADGAAAMTRVSIMASTSAYMPGQAYERRSTERNSDDTPSSRPCSPSTIATNPSRSISTALPFFGTMGLSLKSQMPQLDGFQCIPRGVTGNPGVLPHGAHAPFQGLPFVLACPRCLNHVQRDRAVSMSSEVRRRAGPRASNITSRSSVNRAGKAG